MLSDTAISSTQQARRTQAPIMHTSTRIGGSARRLAQIAALSLSLGHSTVGRPTTVAQPRCATVACPAACRALGRSQEVISLLSLLLYTHNTPQRRRRAAAPDRSQVCAALRLGLQHNANQPGRGLMVLRAGTASESPPVSANRSTAVSSHALTAAPICLPVVWQAPWRRQ